MKRIFQYCAIVIVVCLFKVAAGTVAMAQGADAGAQSGGELAPPSNFKAIDLPFDNGEQVILSWELSPDDPTPRIEQLLNDHGVFVVEALPEAQQRQVESWLDAFRGYIVYRSLTQNPDRVAELDWSLRGVRDILERELVTPATKRQAVVEAVETLRAASDDVRSFENLGEAIDTVGAELEAILQAWTHGESPEKAAAEIGQVLSAIPDTERAAENADRKSKAIAAAKLEATEQVLGESWKSAWEDRQHPLEGLTTEQIQQVRVAREQAAGDVTWEPSDGWQLLGATTPGETTFTADKLSDDESYRFKVVAYGPQLQTSPPVTTAEPLPPTREWFLGNRFWLLIIAFVLCSSIVFWIGYARSGREVKVRKIAGLEAVDEAVGRATEMGRSCLFVPGIQDMNDIQTIAGITILARVARTAAEYDAKVEVPTTRSLVMTTARETVENAYLMAGRPDAYNKNLIYYVTDEQFGYVAYLSGMMVREKPAACFYMGSFYAESLILAETGNAIGAIQVAGTAQPAQLPFFVAACDYTLIGEEFFAASAYLSGSAEELGSLKGQDFGKLVVAVFMIVGIFIATLASVTHSEQLLAIVEYIRQTMLT